MYEPKMLHMSTFVFMAHRIVAE